MKIVFSTVVLAILLMGCVHTDTSKVPELPGDLSLTAPPEYPGYLLIAPEDLKSILTRMREAEAKLERIYEEQGASIP